MQDVLVQGELVFLSERKSVVSFPQCAGYGYDDEYVKRMKVGQNSGSIKYDTLPIEPDRGG